MSAWQKLYPDINSENQNRNGFCLVALLDYNILAEKQPIAQDWARAKTVHCQKTLFTILSRP